MNKCVKICDVPLKKSVYDVKFSSAKETNIKAQIVGKDTLTPLPDNVLGERLYCLGDKLYLQNSGQIFMLKKGEWENVLTSDFLYKPNLAILKNRGEETILVFDKYNARFLNCQDTSFVFSFNSSYCSSLNKIFVSNGRSFYVAYAFNVSSGNDDFKIEKCIQTEPSEGDIVGITEYDNEVLILSQHKIITFSYTSRAKDIVVKRVQTKYFNAKKDTLCKCGDSLVFISDNQLAIYKNEKLDFIPLPSVFEEGEIYSSCAEVNQNLYLIPVLIEGEKYLYVFDLEEKTFSFIKTEALGLSKNGGYFIQDGGVYQIQKERIVERGIANFNVESDFGYLDKKSLYNLRLKVIGSATLIVCGDKNQKRFDVKEGINVLPINLTSKKFRFYLENKSHDFYCDEIQATYFKIGG